MIRCRHGHPRYMVRRTTWGDPPYCEGCRIADEERERILAIIEGKAAPTRIANVDDIRTAIEADHA